MARSVSNNQRNKKTHISKVSLATSGPKSLNPISLLKCETFVKCKNKRFRHGLILDVLFLRLFSIVSHLQKDTMMIYTRVFLGFIIFGGFIKGYFRVYKGVLKGYWFEASRIRCNQHSETWSLSDAIHPTIPSSIPFKNQSISHLRPKSIPSKSQNIPSKTS